MSVSVPVSPSFGYNNCNNEKGSCREAINVLCSSRGQHRNPCSKKTEILPASAPFSFPDPAIPRKRRAESPHSPAFPTADRSVGPRGWRRRGTRRSGYGDRQLAVNGEEGLGTWSLWKGTRARETLRGARGRPSAGCRGRPKKREWGGGGATCNSVWLSNTRPLINRSGLA